MIQDIEISLVTIYGKNTVDIAAIRYKLSTNAHPFVMSGPVNPLHPEIIPRLDPEFAAFYNANLANQLQAHQVPWDPAIRTKDPVVGGAPPLDVGLIEDISLSKCQMRVFWPEDPSKAPPEGWPVFLFFHGGEDTFFLSYRNK